MSYLVPPRPLILTSLASQPYFSAYTHARAKVGDNDVAGYLLVPASGPSGPENGPKVRMNRHIKTLGEYICCVAYQEFQLKVIGWASSRVWPHHMLMPCMNIYAMCAKSLQFVKICNILYVPGCSYAPLTSTPEPVRESAGRRVHAYAAGTLVPLLHINILS